MGLEGTYMGSAELNGERTALPGTAAQNVPCSGVRSHAFRCALALALVLGIPLAAQSPGNSSPWDVSRSRAGSVGHEGPPVLDNTSIPNTNPMEARRMRALNEQRHKSLVSDADRLLRLAMELHTEITEDSPEQSAAVRLRTAAEIEKLAKAVKNKMSYVIETQPSPSNPWEPFSK